MLPIPTPELNGKDAACQRRRCRLNPWVGKIPWRRKWQPTPVFLPGERLGQRSLAGYSPRGCKESDRTERLNNNNPHCRTGSCLESGMALICHVSDFFSCETFPWSLSFLVLTLEENTARLLFKKSYSVICPPDNKRRHLWKTL